MAALSHQELVNYVKGPDKRKLAADTLLLDMTHNLLKRQFTELVFSRFNTVSQVKERVYTFTGSKPDFVKITLDGTPLNDDSRTLQSYNPKQRGLLHVVDTDPFSNARGGQLDDVSLVEKYEISDEDYAKRTDTFLAFKKKMLAKNPNWKPFQNVARDRAIMEKENISHRTKPDRKTEEPEETVKRVHVEDRCEVFPGGRRGVVMYVGPVPELKSKYNEPGTMWVGVKFDEPLGKGNGTVGKKQYFEAATKYGGFVNPTSVKVGDYPERDIMDTSDEDEEL